jgi:tripartite-type tricarboxylate transporter receptor subunit TctC
VAVPAIEKLSASEAARTYIEQQIEQWAKVVKDNNIKAE